MLYVLSHSLKGVIHERDGRPCQDSSGNFFDESLCMVVVADGHGSARYDRSEFGSELVVEQSIETIKELHQKGELEPGRLNKLRDFFPRMLVRKWRAAVLEKSRSLVETGDSELTPAEAEMRLPKQDEIKRPDRDNDDVDRFKEYERYGTTAIVSFVYKKKLFLAQLGDGEILVVRSDGTVRSVCQSEERSIGDVTLSLCEPDADDARKWNTEILEFGTDPTEEIEGYPTNKMVLICSDGVSNAFKKEEDFEKLAADIYKMLHENGFSWVDSMCERWLERFSKFSGDDVSIGIIWCDEDNRYEAGGEKHLEAEADPVGVKPDPVEVKPDPVEVKPDPVEVKPDPVEVKPDPVEVKPDPVEVKPDPVEVKPDPDSTCPNTRPSLGKSGNENAKDEAFKKF